MQVSAAGFAQRLTMQKTQASLKEVFTEIKRQTGYNVVWDSELLKNSKPVEAKFDNEEVCKVLDQILVKQNLDYTIADKTIVIKENKKTSFLENFFDRFNNIDVSGKILDENGKPLPGASVKVKKTGKGVSTDKDGRFFLRGVEEGALLVVSFIGYLPKEVSASANMGSVVLEQSLSKLDEIQVIAYGITTRRLNTSNIVSIKGEDIAKQPISNVLLGLQGRVPGIYLGQTSGVAGADVRVRVQGQNSLGNGNEAFYVIDGVPYIPQNLYTGISQSILPAGSGTLNFLNPSDIESVEILKDADATAIYGSRAANGAILITTKKGKIGSTKVDLNVQSGWGEIAKKIELLNTQQYLEIRKEANKNANRPVRPTDYDINGEWDQNRYTDWQKILIGNTSHYTNVQASISGGNNQTQFLVGTGYIRESSVFLGDFANDKGNVHMNINHKSKDEKFTFNINSNFLKDQNKLPSIDLTTSAITLAPNAPPLYNEDGTINWEPLSNATNRYTFSTNPAAVLLRKYNAKTDNLLTNTLVGYQLIPGLTIKTSLGYNKLVTDELYTNPQTSYAPSATVNLRQATYGTRKIDSWIAEPQLTYNKSFSFGDMQILLGSTFQSTKKSVIAFDGSNYSNDEQLENSLAAGTIVPNFNTMQSEYRYNAIFTRLNYQYQNKYVLNLTARRDGSSRFGSANLFHSFYSIGSAWIFSDENFVKKNFSWLSFGKLKASYGTTGNDQIQDYQFLNLYDIYNINTSIPYQQIVGLLPSGHSNPYLQWEETRKLNIGLDLGFFKNRILANINFYRNRSSNQLLGATLPNMTGFNTILRNIPALVENKGWELLIDATPVTSESLKWSISANLTLPKNTLINYPGLDVSPDREYYIVGQPTNLVRTFEMVGVNKETGLYEFKTFDGKITSTPDPQTDKLKTITLGPTLFGGISNNFVYKNLELSFLFQYVKQNARNYKFGAVYPGTVNTNQPIGILGRWQKPGDETSIQQVNPLGGAYQNAVLSDAAYSDGSFLRLKNISLSYSLPKKWVDKTHLSLAKIFLHGQNIATITKFNGGDPETGIPTTLPPIRMITMCIQLTF